MCILNITSALGAAFLYPASSFKVKSIYSIILLTTWRRALYYYILLLVSRAGPDPTRLRKKARKGLVPGVTSVCPGRRAGPDVPVECIT